MTNTTTQLRLGEFLQAKCLLQSESLTEALANQARYGGKIGEWLSAIAGLHPRGLLRTLAKREKTLLIDAVKYPCDATLLRAEDMNVYTQKAFIPWQRVEGRLIVLSPAPTKTLKAELEARYGCIVMLFYATQRDLRGTLERAFGEKLSTESRVKLLRSMPKASAATTVTTAQKIGLTLLGLTSAAMVYAYPQAALIASLAAINAIYWLMIGFKYALFMAGKTPRAEADIYQLKPSTLPVYSILVPMYKEAEGIPRLLAAMRALDYPKTKLDIKLVIEADDEQTWQAICKAKPEPYFDVIRVPPSEPRTKPKACNYALNFVRGDYVTIYDAEDRPEPMQLKKAVAAFQAAPNDVVCLQARLNYFNYDENLLTRCFAIEYASLFDRMLPALEKLGIPIPLGGTSNHINLTKLREVGEWDPFNVTEDADLGLRLAMRGYYTQTLNSVTLEEATLRFVPWLKQRSRWIKGYMQTWLVHMREPLKARRALGARGFWGFHLMIGLPCLVFLLSPFMWGFAIAWLAGAFTLPAAAWLIWPSIGAFAIGAICHLHYAARMSQQWKWKRMGWAIAAYPFYWFCHSLASLKALWQLIVKPHYWEKTTHSITRYGHREIENAMLELEKTRKAA